jgi:hypothetical protein
MERKHVHTLPLYYAFASFAKSIERIKFSLDSQRTQNTAVCTLQR